MSEIISETPSWFVVLALLILVLQMIKYSTKGFKALLKFIIVWRKGFPPQHCDALGDAYEEEGKEEESNG